MCNDPQPNSFAPSGWVACRVCNECITAYKNDWVARAMAEKATMGHALVLMLSYPNNPDGTLSDSARAFRYKDVQDFMKRVRKAYCRHYEISPKGEISYIIAGELGADTKRVHWHMVLFSKQSLHPVGQWATLKGIRQDGPKITKKGWNQKWSLWSDQHGFVCPQVPDQGGVAYVLKYAMKDQFNVVKAKGTARFTKSERHAASMFRMSKKPAIGWRYLQNQIDRWEERGSVPPDLLVKIPEYSGYWWPKGTMRDAALKALHDVNLTIREDHGRDAPQWAALLASVAARDSDQQLLRLRQKQGDWEREKNEQNIEKHETIRRQTLAARAANLIARRERGEALGPYLRPEVARSLTEAQYAAYAGWVEAQYAKHRHAAGGTLTSDAFIARWTARHGRDPHPFDPEVLNARNTDAARPTGKFAQGTGKSARGGETQVPPGEPARPAQSRSSKRVGGGKANTSLRPVVPKEIA